MAKDIRLPSFFQIFLTLGAFLGLTSAFTTMMGVGQGLGIPAPITAGAVLSGVYFGDKMSPLSDSVVLAAGMFTIQEKGQSEKT